GHNCTEVNEMSRPGEGGAGTTRPPAARWLGPLAVVSLAALVAGQVLGFAISPPERDMGHLQKILYVHVPAAWSAFLAAVILFIFSVLYLVRRQEDRKSTRLNSSHVKISYAVFCC